MPATLKDVRHRPRVALGCLSLAAETKPPREQAIATVQWALENGVSIIDTADCYGVDGGADHGSSELIVADALDRSGRGLLDTVVLATKGGLRREPNNQWVPNGRPDYLRQACRASLVRLRVEQIPLYQLHRPDPSVPYEESVGALQELRCEGLICDVGVSNVDDDLLDRALETGPIASVQNQFSLLHTDDRPMLRRCEVLDLPYLAWSPFGGRFHAQDLPSLLAGSEELALSLGLTVYELVLAWLIHNGSHVFGIVGALSPQQVQSSLRAATTELATDDVKHLEELARNANIPMTEPIRAPRSQL